MKSILLLISLLLSINAFSQSYQEEDFYGFWRKQKTTYKNIWDTETFNGFNYIPINFLYFKKDHTITVFEFNRISYNYGLSHKRSNWKFEPNEKGLQFAKFIGSDKFVPFPVHALKPNKKLVLQYRIVLMNDNVDSNITFNLDKSELEILTTYRKCSKEEVMNVSLIDSLYILNREVNNIEWRDYAYDLENKGEIIYSDQIATNESIIKQFDPVLNITHEEAVAFCEWKTRQIKNLFDLDVVVRLPTQKEWEVLSLSIKNGSRYRMQEDITKPDVDSFYLKKPVKLLADAYEWCAESGLVYSPIRGAEPISAASTTKTGFRYIIDFQ